MPPRRKQRALSAVPEPVPEEDDAEATGPGGARNYRKRANLGGSPQSHEEQAWYFVNYEDGDFETKELRWRPVPADEIRCRAIIRTRNNPWKGSQCARAAGRGMTVCASHGGSLPAVKKAAARRLALASDPAAERLIHMALYQKDIADADRLKALVQILDRAGVAGKTTIELEVKPWQAVLQRVYGMVHDKAGAEIDLEEGVDYEVLGEGEEVTL
jgi:hypothetical protein